VNVCSSASEGDRMGRRKEATERAAEIKEQAKAVAGEGSEALKEFAAHTGTAAKEFANKAGEAAKELVESIEKAAKGVSEKDEPKRGRRLLKLTVAIGAAAFVATNEGARKAIKSLIGRGGDSAQSDQPEIWRPQTPTTGNGGSAPKATTSATDPTKP
jgi:hypothetical protein